MLAQHFHTLVQMLVRVLVVVSVLCVGCLARPQQDIEAVVQSVARMARSFDSEPGSSQRFVRQLPPPGPPGPPGPYRYIAMAVHILGETWILQN